MPTVHAESATRRSPLGQRRKPSFKLAPFALLLALLLASLHATAITAQTTPRAAAPESWIGFWRGTLTNFGGGDSVKLRVPVTMEIASTAIRGRLKWRTVYNGDTTRSMKDYSLIVLDSAAGRYATDENNGILIDETLTGGILVSVFQVGDQLIENRIGVQGDSLVQDLIFWKSTPIRSVQGAGPNGEKGTPVLSFRVSGRQRLALARDRRREVR